LYCWSPASFWSIIFLHSIKKKRKKELSVIKKELLESSQSSSQSGQQLEREFRERCSPSLEVSPPNPAVEHHEIISSRLPWPVQHRRLCSSN
jgi:hypothetical protein